MEISLIYKNNKKNLSCDVYISSNKWNSSPNTCVSLLYSASYQQIITLISRSLITLNANPWGSGQLWNGFEDSDSAVIQTPPMLRVVMPAIAVVL